MNISQKIQNRFFMEGLMVFPFSWKLIFTRKKMSIYKKHSVLGDLFPKNISLHRPFSPTFSSYRVSSQSVFRSTQLKRWNMPVLAQNSGGFKNTLKSLYPVGRWILLKIEPEQNMLIKYHKNGNLNFKFLF